MKIQSTKNFGTGRLKIIVYGPSGVGKTTLASTINEPTLVISAEGGLLSIKDHDIDFIDISVDDDGNKILPENRYDRFKQALLYVASQEARKKYKWIFIDSITEIGQNISEALSKKYPEKKDGLLKWGEYSDQLRALIKYIRDIPEYNVVFTALSITEKDELNRRFTAIDVQGKIAAQLPGYFDEVFYFSQYEDDQGNKQRKLVTSGSDKVVCKDRSGKLEQLEEPNLGLIYKKIIGA